MIQALKFRLPSGTSPSIPAIMSRVVSYPPCGVAASSASRPSNSSSWQLYSTFRVFRLCKGRSIEWNKTSTVQARSLSMLHQGLGVEAQAQFHERDVGNCILLTPEEKVSERPTNYGSLFPCPQQNKPPRIEHLLFLEDGNIVELVSNALSLPPSYVEELIHFGAVYYALVCPPPPKGFLTPAQMELYQKASLLYQNKKRPSLKGKTFVEAQKTFRVTSTHEGIEAGTYVRVHVNLKRFPRCYEVDWRSRVIAETESYVVLDKPAGVPVGGPVDNIVECCATFTARALGLRSSLRLTHQLDNCTEGCVVLAKTKEFASKFHLLLRNKEVQKYYLALAAAPVPLGRVSHFMRPGLRHPRIVSTEPHPGWTPCQLEVLESREVLWPTAEAEAKYQIQDFGWEPKKLAYECKVQLLTGRTHQVRAQFAALGAPLIGDSMYMPAAVSRLRSPELYPFSFGIADTVIDDDCALEKWVSQHGTEPECGIGLQASQISWDDGACIFKAREPWWRCSK